jgi:ribosomal protein S27E
MRFAASFGFFSSHDNHNPLSLAPECQKERTRMDVIFNCPKCDQELAVDSAGAGQEINCPSCGEAIIIPRGDGAGRPVSGDSERGGGGIPTIAPVNPIATSAAAKVEMHLRVPVHKTTESLIEKPLAPLEVAAKDTDKKIRVKTIRHTDCIEVGHDKFDEVVTNFLIKIGEANIVNITPLTYTHLDIGSQKLMTEYGVMVVYKG